MLLVTALRPFNSADLPAAPATGASRSHRWPCGTGAWPRPIEVSAPSITTTQQPQMPARPIVLMFIIHLSRAASDENDGHSSRFVRPAPRFFSEDAISVSPGAGSDAAAVHRNGRLTRGRRRRSGPPLAAAARGGKVPSQPRVIRSTMATDSHPG